MKTLKVLVQRVAKEPTYTIGKLYIEGHYFCDTAEDKVRELVDKNADGDFDDTGEGKVFGLTAIPAGTYKLTLSMSNRFKRVLPEIHVVHGFSGVRIHAGNTAEDSHGCLIVGINDKKGWVSRSRNYETALVAKLQSYFDDGFTATITIE